MIDNQESSPWSGLVRDITGAAQARESPQPRWAWKNFIKTEMLREVSKPIEQNLACTLHASIALIYIVFQIG